MSRRTTSKQTYAFCPASPQELPQDRVALTVFLQSHAYRPARHVDASPDLLVIAPPPPELALTKSHLGTEDLRVFQEGFGGRVLYVQPELPPLFSTTHLATVPGVFRFGNRSEDSISELRAWLDEGRKWTKTQPVPYTFEAIALAHDELYGSESPRYLPTFLKYVSEEFPGFGFGRFPKSPQWWDCLFAFFHIAGSYDVLEHDLNRVSRHPFAQTAQDHMRLRQKRETLNVAADLWKSLRAAASFRRDASWHGDTPCILVVDDNPQGIRNDIVRLITTLMPGYEVWFWNPTEEDVAGESSDLFDHLIRYCSMVAGKIDEEREVGSKKGTKNGGEESLSSVGQTIVALSVNGSKNDAQSPIKMPLAEVLQRSRFVLVDLLFRQKGTEGEYGAALIRGLRRFCVDHLLQQENKALSIPHFVALSRSDDLEKIQRALRAGASGYILKSRLMSLPAELARLRAGTGQDGSSLHRNFRALDFLPSETRGFLHEVRIPRIRFDRPEHTKDDAPKYPSERRQQVAALLRAIPKPDLHLHVGSCMTPEFLVVASIVMLAERHNEQMKRQNSSRIANAKEWRTSLMDAIPPLFRFWSGQASLTTFFAPNSPNRFRLIGAKLKNTDPVDALGRKVRAGIKMALSATHSKPCLSVKEFTEVPHLRSVLHAKLDIRDHWPLSRVLDELDAKDAVTLMLFAITTGQIQLGESIWQSDIDKKDLLRLFILFLAAQYESSIVTVEDTDLVSPLKAIARDPIESSPLKEFGERLQQVHECALRWSDALKKGEDAEELSLNVSLVTPSMDLLRARPVFCESPLEFLVASGTRGRTLAEYLAGCEYGGAEHLQRPCLMALYARQTLEYLVRHGVFYAELRSAASGYMEKDILTYQQACTLFRDAFEKEQQLLMKAYRESVSIPGEFGNHKNRANSKGWAWCTHGKNRWAQVFEIGRSTNPLRRYFPAKVNLIFTGKRHKATREMLMEAAAGVVLNSESTSRTISAREFTADNMTRCRVVGFDLAGLEESFPPEMFRVHFDQLSRMHIPITAHAGENASARFVESAVLDLRARRLGHGLALADDEKLMARVREERICIELCPVSNYQTNEFSDSRTGREYPLKKFLAFGNIVCLNTDNPTVSYTNIVKEYFQASYAYGGDGLSLWDALRMIRMGFAHAFKGLAERRALIELVEQMIFDILIDPSVEELLRELDALSRVQEEEP